jgi:uncharacterized flavoprotein (TIGR03862 family)
MQATGSFPPDGAARAAVIGGGPAGLMAAEVLARAGLAVTIHDRMPSLSRKFLMAGRGGLNLTHAEPLDRFLDRYRDARLWLEPAIQAFPPRAVMDWAEGLGQPVFTGSSGRVFPRAMKASPLLRAWFGRLAGQGVAMRPRWEWRGWADGGLLFQTPNGPRTEAAEIAILALGGASWPRLGSDGAWAGHFPDHMAPFKPANCGFEIPWSDHLRHRMAGHPLKRVIVHAGTTSAAGEAVITEYGIEGGAIYAVSAELREAIARDGWAEPRLDLRPDLDAATLRARLDAPRRGQSLSTFLRKAAGLSPEAIALVQDAIHAGAAADLPALIKSLPLRVTAPRPLARAISSAGGLRRDALDHRFMLRDRPGVFAAGEMLDWEAPTGGYLLQACLSTGRAAAMGALEWLRKRPGP